MYKCSACGKEDKFIGGLVNLSSNGGYRRLSITHCEHCNSYHLYESADTKVDSTPIRKLELTKEEAVELMIKMKSCSDPKDTGCKCNTHKFINNFSTRNEHRMVAV